MPLLAWTTAPVAFGPEAWGVDALRYLPSIVRVIPYVAMLLLLFPRPLETPARSFGDWTASKPLLASVILGFICAAVVLALPDRAHAVGDFLLRQGTVELAAAPSVLYPQALPLDVLLHYRLPLFFADAHLLNAAQYGRALGALEAFLLGALSVALARAFGMRGLAAAALACAAAWTGALGLMSGYSKAFSEMALLTIAVAAFGTRVAREGRGVPGLSLACALGLALHRSALAFIPAALVAVAIAARDPALRPRLATKAALAASVVFVAALCLFLPKIVATALSFDRAQHFASEDVTRAGGLLAASFQPGRLVDLLNVAFFFTPLLPLAVILSGGLRRRDVLVVLALALSWGALAFVLFPAQGAFRDWDVFAPFGVALAILAGSLAAVAVRKGDGWPAAIPVVCLTGVLLALLGAWDREGTWRKMEAIVTGPPARTPVERAKTWDYLASSWFQAGRFADATRAFSHAAETSRSQRIYLSWAVAAHEARDYAQEQKVLEELVAFAPQTAIAWQRLGSMSWQNGDYATAARAARELVKLAPGDADLRQRAEYVERYYAAWRDSVSGRR